MQRRLAVGKKKNKTNFEECPLLYRRDACSNPDVDCLGNGNKPYGCHTLKGYLEKQYEAPGHGKQTDMSKDELKRRRPHYNALIKRIRNEILSGKLNERNENARQTIQ